jgi:hypothetical protein
LYDVDIVRPRSPGRLIQRNLVTVTGSLIRPDGRLLMTTNTKVAPLRFLISFDDGSMDHIPEADMPSVGEATHQVVREAKSAGVWIFGCGLLRQQSTIVATDGGVTAGAVPETKAVVGGFSIIEVSSREEAHVWAARFAAACRCAQEVREIMYDPES